MLRGGAAYFFLEHTASTDIQRLDLSDEELGHLKLEFCVMAMGMLSGDSVPSAPIHGDILLTVS